MPCFKKITQKSSENKNLNHSVIHSRHNFQRKGKSNSNLTLNLLQSQNQCNRFSLGSPVKTDNRTGMTPDDPSLSRYKVKYINYPLLFQNKSINIQRILKHKKSYDHLQNILKNRKTEKVNIQPQNNTFSNFEGILNNKNIQNKAVRKSLQGKISCSGSQYPSTSKQVLRLCKKRLWQKRREQFRCTEAPQTQSPLKPRYGKQQKLTMNIDIEMNLSPWHQKSDHLQN